MMGGQDITLTKRVNVTIEMQKVRDAVERWNKRAAFSKRRGLVHRACLTDQEVTKVLTEEDALSEFFLYAYECDVDCALAEELIMFATDVAAQMKEEEGDGN
jgi:nuclear transport factor 2 (NTF2) superfamily protein